jgi:hypothetical protein
MPVFPKSCSVCAAPPDVRAAVNDALAHREKLRDLEKRSGFSRSTLSRHGRRCIVRDTLAAHREKLGGGDRFFVVWPNAQVPADLPPDVWLAVVQYEKPLIERLHEAALAEDSKRAVAKAQPSPYQPVKMP